jgi:hypothetical protein
MIQQRIDFSGVIKWKNVVKKTATISEKYCNMRETRKNTRFNVAQQCVYIHRSDELFVNPG